MASAAITKIGGEAYIVRDGKLLLGLRQGAFGAGTWGLPGGHMEHLERADQTVVRELAEEIGVTLQPSDAKLLAVTDDLEPSTATHYLHLTFSCDIGQQEPKLMEPEFCAQWRWFPLDELPDNLFAPHVKILQTIASNQVYLS